MAQDLKDLCNLTIIDTDIYGGNKDNWFVNDYSLSKKRPVRWINEEKVLDLVAQQHPDFVIVNSGGLSLKPQTITALKNKNVKTVGISLSDPDVFPENGKIYAEYYDLFYTNSKFALTNLYSPPTNIHLLPFAASPRLHRPLPAVEKIYDIVVVGHARPERVKIVKKLQKLFKVGLFGAGWDPSTKSVHGEDHVRAINSGKMYLSFAETVAGYNNVKVGLFEAIACRTCAVTKLFDETESYFKYGVDLLGYENDADVIDLVGVYSNNSKLRNWITDNSYKRLLLEHTWKKRWEMVLNDIEHKLG
jgi:spore maturation protein CgeB